MRWRLTFGVAVPFLCLGACGSGHSAFDNKSPNSASSGGNDDDGSNGSSSGGFGSNPNDPGTFINTDDGGVIIQSGPCKGGHYDGTFKGSYTSHLTGVGIPIPVTGNVDMTLEQQGGADMTCHPAGEIPVPCNEVFTLKNGTITGVADALKVKDAAAGGFPYFCTMTGTLDCSTKKLIDGWIQCSYCVGPLADGGMSCKLLNGVAGTTGVGGHFAGPLTADYNVATFSFVNGVWNGAEALAGNDGTMPGPDGGSISDYLTKDGGIYLGPNHFGGVGTWNATFDGALDASTGTDQ